MGWETQPLPCRPAGGTQMTTECRPPAQAEGPGGREQEDPAEPQARARGQLKWMPTSRTCWAPYWQAAFVKGRCEQLRQLTARQRQGAWGGAGDHSCLPGAGPSCRRGGTVLQPQNLIPQSSVQTAPHTPPPCMSPHIPAPHQHPPISLQVPTRSHTASDPTCGCSPDGAETPLMATPPHSTGCTGPPLAQPVPLGSPPSPFPPLS